MRGSGTCEAHNYVNTTSTTVFRGQGDHEQCLMVDGPGRKYKLMIGNLRLELCVSTRRDSIDVGAGWDHDS